MFIPSVIFFPMHATFTRSQKKKINACKIQTVDYENDRNHILRLLRI